MDVLHELFDGCYSDRMHNVLFVKANVYVMRGQASRQKAGKFVTWKSFVSSNCMYKFISILKI